MVSPSEHHVESNQQKKPPPLNGSPPLRIPVKAKGRLGPKRPVPAQDVGLERDHGQSGCQTTGSVFFAPSKQCRSLEGIIARKAQKWNSDEPELKT